MSLCDCFIVLFTWLCLIIIIVSGCCCTQRAVLYCTAFKQYTTCCQPIGCCVFSPESGSINHPVDCSAINHPVERHVNHSGDLIFAGKVHVTLFRVRPLVVEIVFWADAGRSQPFGLHAAHRNKVRYALIYIIYISPLIYFYLGSTKWLFASTKGLIEDAL